MDGRKVVRKDEQYGDGDEDGAAYMHIAPYLHTLLLLR